MNFFLYINHLAMNLLFSKTLVLSKRVVELHKKRVNAIVSKEKQIKLNFFGFWCELDCSFFNISWNNV